MIQLIDKDDGSDEINKLRAAGLIRSKAGAPPLLSGPPSLSGPPLLTSVSNKRSVLFSVGDKSFGEVKRLPESAKFFQHFLRKSKFYLNEIMILTN